MTLAVDRAVKPHNKQKITTRHFLTTRPAVGCWLGKKVGTLILPFNRWLKLFNCQIFSRLAFGIKGCSSKTSFISSIFRLLCISLWHYLRVRAYYIHCIFRLGASVYLRISVMKKKKKKKKNLHHSETGENPSTF